MKKIMACYRVLSVILICIGMLVFVESVSAREICTVTVSELRLRQKPARKARVITNLVKGMTVIAEDRCSGGWVKVQSEDGRYSGYVGGWAISPVTFATAAAPVAVPVAVAVAGEASVVKEIATTPETASPVVPVIAKDKEIPSNEMLAVQITELRLKVIGIEKNLKSVTKDVQGLKLLLKQKKQK